MDRSKRFHKGLRHYSKVSNSLYENFFGENDHDRRNRSGELGSFLNSMGYNSSEILASADTVFLGCSNTFGYGLEPRHIWSSLLSKDIFPDSSCHNLGLNGASIEEIVFNVFNYFNIYGNPKTILFLIPELYRGLDDGVNSQIRAYQFYSMLETYCKKNNILLLSTTWSHESPTLESTNDFMSDKFESFFKIDLTEYQRLVYDYCNEHKDEKDLILASDGVHLGKAQHHAYYKLFKKQITERL